MKELRKTLLLLTVLVFSALSLANCRETEKSNAEEMIEEVEDGVEEVGDEVEDAADGVEDGLEDAGDEVEDAVDSN